CSRAASCRQRPACAVRSRAAPGRPPRGSSRSAPRGRPAAAPGGRRGGGPVGTSRRNLHRAADPSNGAYPVYPIPLQMSDARSAFLARSERGGMVPLVREVVLDADTPLAAFVKVARPPFAFLLESLVGGERWARYTFLGTEPREVWRCRGRAIVVANVEVPARAAAAERLRLYDAAEARLAELIVRLRGRHELVPLALRDTLPAVPTTSRYPRAAFERDVSRILEYIRAGDT